MIGGGGLYYMRARWYDPEIGRFLSEDPIGVGGGLNLYAFGKNDPINKVDPSGTRMCILGSTGFDEIIRLKNGLEQATNTTFTLTSDNCVDESSIKFRGDPSFTRLYKGFLELVKSPQTFDLAFTNDFDSSQEDPFTLSVYKLSNEPGKIDYYYTGEWGRCDMVNENLQMSRTTLGQLIAHELIHHIPVARGRGMNASERQAIVYGDNVVNRARGAPPRCTHYGPYPQ